MKGEPALDRGILLLAQGIRVVVLDVDGVLTDGTLDYTAAGETHKRFFARDGLGIRLLLDAGLEVAVLSARTGAPLARRLADLGVTEVMTGRRDKRAALEELLLRRSFTQAEVCFVGDDLLDVPALEWVGLGVAVGDAHPSALQVARVVTRAEGGRGAVREVADLLLEAKFGQAEAYRRHLELERARAASESVQFGVIIPSRYASTRLPGKPLRDICGKPMIVRVLENAQKSGASFVWVATDDERIREAVAAAGGQAIMTSSEHATGTDRLAEVIERESLDDETIIVNAQGDEPLLEAHFIRGVAEALAARPHAGLSTLATPLREPEEIANPNVVKVVRSADGFALLFSRAALPFVQKGTAGWGASALEFGHLRHVGLYAYRAKTLRTLSRTPRPLLEQAENLEQLRALWLGIPIYVDTVQEPPGHGVDTESDLARVIELFERR